SSDLTRTSSSRPQPGRLLAHHHLDRSEVRVPSAGRIDCARVDARARERAGRAPRALATTAGAAHEEHTLGASCAQTVDAPLRHALATAFDEDELCEGEARLGQSQRAHRGSLAVASE